MRSSEKKRIYCVWIILQKIDWLIQVGKNNEKLILTQRPYTNSCVKKKSSWQRFFHNREFHNVNCRFCGALHNVDWANISVLSQVIHNVNERKTVQTNMISFVSHGDKTLQRLIGMSSEQKHHISFISFFFFITYKILTCERTLISAPHNL